MAGVYVQPVDPNHVAAFLRHYQNQYGHGFPVYHGERLQSGAGLGSILRGIGRFLFPILAPAAKTFIGSTIEGHEQGKSIKDALRGALEPTLGTAISATTSQISKRMGRNQSGGRRRRRRSNKKQAGSRKRTYRKHRKMVYKGQFGGRKRKRSSQKRRRGGAKRIRHLNPAFANF